MSAYEKINQMITERMIARITETGDLIKVNPHALANLADGIDSDVTTIQELLDDFIYLNEAEKVLAE